MMRFAIKQVVTAMLSSITQETKVMTNPLRALKSKERLAERLAQFDILPETAFVDIKLVCALCDRSPSSIQRDVKAGRLAPPIKLGPGTKSSVRWHVGDVRRFLKGGAP
jgi:predicted DNA-binding transcriptional regulator AlpA